MIKNISNLGDAALYCDFGSEVNKSINSKVIKYFKTIKKNYIENIDLDESQNINSKKLEIPVCCDEKFSMDIKRLEETLKLSREKILEKFLSKEYFCYMTGFIAGMPFLGD